MNIVFPGRALTSMTQSLCVKGLPGPMKIMMLFFKIFLDKTGERAHWKHPDQPFLQQQIRR